MEVENENKYQRGKIYTIRSPQTDEIYIGSTIDTLSKRFYKHKNDFKRWKTGKYSYVTSYKILEYDDCYIELLEMCPCNNKMELERKEGQLIRADDNAVNKIQPGRTYKQYRLDNKEKIREQSKEYYYNNIDKVKKYKNQYYLDNADEVKERTKQYRDHHPKEIKQYQTQYRIDKADKIKEHRNQRHNCECGGKYQNGNKSTHMKSKKHLKYLENL